MRTDLITADVAMRAAPVDSSANPLVGIEIFGIAQRTSREKGEEKKKKGKENKIIQLLARLSAEVFMG